MIVLHTVSAPDGSTRFIDQMEHTRDSQTELAYFSWRFALLGRYDVLHIHWPEVLVDDRRRGRSLGKRIATRFLLSRLRRRRTLVVRTLHNVQPHERGLSASSVAMLGRIDDATDLFVRLNPTTAPPRNRPVVTILHGHYRDRFASSARSQRVAGRVLHFGLIKPYKRLDTLMTAFAAVDDPSLSLRIVGKPSGVSRAEIESRAAEDPRISTELRFVSDDELVTDFSEAELVVLPYGELENSGVALVALSLDRPVLLPRTASTEALRDEVGAHWVHLYHGDFTSTTLTEAISAVRSEERSAPDLGGRDWDEIGRLHRLAYAEGLRRLRGGR